MKKEKNNIWTEIKKYNHEEYIEQNELIFSDDYKKDEKPLIEVKNLNKTFYYLKNFKRVEKNLYDNLNFKIYENEKIALLGSNGVGKTTIVNILSSFIKPTSGEIIYNEKLTNNSIGVQFQDIKFPNCLTVKDLIDFELEINKIKIEPREFEEMLFKFKLKPLIDTKISKLSGGQQQRLNVLISLLSKPKILFLDEFTTGLDIAVKNEIKDFIIQFCNENKITIVLISHDNEIINDVAERFILIENKKIIVDATKEKILQKHNSIFEFLNKYIR